MSFDSHEKFNLRDLSRFFSVYTSPLHSHLSKEQRLFMAFEINCAKIISTEFRALALQEFCRSLKIDAKFDKSFVLRNTSKEIKFYLPAVNHQKEAVLTFPKNISQKEVDERGKHVLTTPFNLSHGIYSYYLYLLSI